MLDENEDRYTIRKALSFEVGSHNFGKSKPGDFDKYGIGIQLYFKFLKNLMFIFSFIAILSIPIIKTCIESKILIVSSSLRLRYINQYRSIQNDIFYHIRFIRSRYHFYFRCL